MSRPHIRPARRPPPPRIPATNHLKHARRFAALLSLVVCLSGASQSQTLDAHVSISSLAPARAHVEGRRTGATKVWSFRNAYAGLSNLGERLENLSLTDADGARVNVRRLASGEYEAERDASGFSYDIKLAPPSAPADAANVSWLAGDHGVLMPGDLLPLPLSNVKLRLTLPSGWNVSSAETKTGDNLFELSDAENAVFLVGRALRERRVRVSGSMTTTFVTTGDWAFTDEEAATAVGKLLEQHEKILGGPPAKQTHVILAPFPAPVGAQTWSAETRGRTVFLLSGRWPSKTAALAFLNVPLAHELLHLWIPNALALDGDYDWFYEGFTLYQSLRAGMRLGIFTFQDYLNALGRAADGYRATAQSAELSLPDASRRRWSDGGQFVYNKGMLVAFLYDLTLRRQTSNKQSLDDVYRELFRRHSLSQPRREANKAIIEILRAQQGMSDFTERHISSASALDLERAVAPFGLRVEASGARTRLAVNPSLTAAQRELLRKLGYNERASKS
ncbi:MAG TPA: hypothetical protein VNA19_06565 [Pyrinomonadaceae bacterium]|jgi:hypothetical protein|nr:hypothetical protein [Pyrinomonadaceae bacterium]